jgi:hypothetical protein
LFAVDDEFGPPDDVPAPELEVKDEFVGAFVLRREERRRELAHDPVVDVLSGPEYVSLDGSLELLVPILVVVNNLCNEFVTVLTRFVRIDSFVFIDGWVDSTFSSSGLTNTDPEDDDWRREECDELTFFRGLPLRLGKSEKRSICVSELKLIICEICESWSIEAVSLRAFFPGDESSSDKRLLLERNLFDISLTLKFILSCNEVEGSSPNVELWLTVSLWEANDFDLVLIGDLDPSQRWADRFKDDDAIVPSLWLLLSLSAIDYDSCDYFHSI